jgi:hypothetical protein
MRKVLFGTPCYDGKVNAEFLHSLVNTIKMCPPDIEIIPIQVCYDALVQRARNDLFQMAVESGCDDIIFMDADQEWNPEWIFTLLNHPVDVVGGTVIKKSDEIAFNVKILDSGMKVEENGLIEVVSVGTGFLRVSKEAIQSIWEISSEYTSQGKTSRLVFDIKIIDGELISEDNIFCRKWADLGGKVYIDPTMTCNHIGVKKYSGNFLEFINSLAVKEMAPSPVINDGIDEFGEAAVIHP